jgi:hypothetical protein
MTQSSSPVRWVLRSTIDTESPFRSEVPSSQGSTSGPLPDQIVAGNGYFRMRSTTMTSGRSAGLELLTIDTGAIAATILPDRGMGLWKCWSGGNEFGWQSPVQGPVHPHYVPVQDSTGIGWLEGFDELLVRCGLYSNGAPEFHANGSVKHPLHGRIANLPTHHLEVIADVENGILDVVGTVVEARFLIYSLELQTRYRFRANSPVIEVIDTVTNRSSKPGSMQLLYHINIGQPVLQSGSKVLAASQTLVARDPRAEEGLSTWDHCEGPTDGFAEQVYFITPAKDDRGWTESMLRTPDASLGLSVHFDTSTLPSLSVWKNTASVGDGYVLGLEPATGFPNTRSVEESQGRVVSLQGGEAKTFRLKLQPLRTGEEVAQATSRIQRLQA